jgi:tetratricopeptide (TPR) repeat protein
MAATLFAFHPSHTESVAWVTVPDPLMSAAILGSVLLYLKYAQKLSAARKAEGKQLGRKSRKADRTENKVRPARLWLVVSAMLCGAAMLFKETAVVVPAMIFALAWFAPGTEPVADATERNTAAGFRSRLFAALRQTLPFVGVATLYLLLRINALQGKLGSLTQHLPWRTVLLSWPAILWFYVKVLLWPIRSRAFADSTLVEQFSAKGVLLPGLAVGVSATILAGALFWATKKARRDLAVPEAQNVEYALLLGTLFLVLPILPALDLNALNPGDFLHGRYAYLPSAGLMLLVATGWHLSGRNRIPLLCAAGLIAATFAGLVMSQEKQWKDDLTVFTVAHELAPGNRPVAHNLANAHVQAALRLADDGRCGEAMPVFEQVSQVYPDDWYAWAGLGECFAQLNNLPKAEESMHRAADLSHAIPVIQQWQEVRAAMGLPNSAVPR